MLAASWDMKAQRNTESTTPTPTRSAPKFEMSTLSKTSSFHERPSSESLMPIDPCKSQNRAITLKKMWNTTKTNSPNYFLSSLPNCFLTCQILRFRSFLFFHTCQSQGPKSPTSPTPPTNRPVSTTPQEFRLSGLSLLLSVVLLTHKMTCLYCLVRQHHLSTPVVPSLHLRTHLTIPHVRDLLLEFLLLS
jgi:hypothetical protein